MAKKQKADQYLYQDGKWIKAGPTLAVVGGSSPSPEEVKCTRRSTYLWPTCFKFPSQDEQSFESLTYSKDSFLNLAIFKDEKVFDFDNHNYYWAFGNNKSRTGTFIKQSCKAERWIDPADFKRCRKKYTNQIQETPTWSSFLTELFTSNFLQYIDDNRSIIVHRFGLADTDQGFKDPTGTIYIEIPMIMTSSTIPQIKQLMIDSPLSWGSGTRGRKESTNWADKPVTYSGLVNIVRDVTVFDRPNNGKQYIPGEVVSRFAINRCHINYPDDLLPDSDLWFSDSFVESDTNYLLISIQRSESPDIYSGGFFVRASW